MLLQEAHPNSQGISYILFQNHIALHNSQVQYFMSANYLVSPCQCPHLLQHQMFKHVLTYVAPCMDAAMALIEGV